MTNPDMLHAAILPDHARWADFFLRLSLVVVDEAHVFRGVFGSHVGHVLRRLRRRGAHSGGDPRVLPALRPTGFSLAAFGIAFYLLPIVLKTMPVGIAYAIWSGLGIVFVSIIGVTVFRQSLDWPAIAGLLLIVIGIAIVNLFSSSVGH